MTKPRKVTEAPTSVDPDELLDANEAAALLRQKPATLAAWRHYRKGPEFIKIGRGCFYRRAAIAAWLADQVVTPSAA